MGLSCPVSSKASQAGGREEGQNGSESERVVQTDSDRATADPAGSGPGRGDPVRARPTWGTHSRRARPLHLVLDLSRNLETYCQKAV